MGRHLHRQQRRYRRLASDGRTRSTSAARQAARTFGALSRLVSRIDADAANPLADNKHYTTPSMMATVGRFMIISGPRALHKVGACLYTGAWAVTSPHYIVVILAVCSISAAAWHWRQRTAAVCLVLGMLMGSAMATSIHQRFVFRTLASPSSHTNSEGDVGHMHIVNRLRLRNRVVQLLCSSDGRVADTKACMMRVSAVFAWVIYILLWVVGKWIALALKRWFLQYYWLYEID